MGILKGWREIGKIIIAKTLRVECSRGSGPAAPEIGEESNEIVFETVTSV